MLARMYDQVVTAARVAGALHPQLARRIGAEEVSLQYPAFDHLAFARCHTIVVKTAAGQRAGQMGPFADAHRFREHRLPQAVEQERSLPVQAATARRMDKIADQRSRQRRFEQHRHLAGSDLARPQTRQRTPCRVVANRFGRSNFGRVARGRIPVLALHRGITSGDQRTGQIMPRGRATTHEAKAVGGNKLPFLQGNACAFRIGDQRTDGEGRLLAPSRQFDGLFDTQMPGMVEIEILCGISTVCQQMCFGQSGAGVGRREAGDVERGLDRLAQGRRGKVGGTGVSLLLPQINRHTDTFVAVVFDGFDLAAAHHDGLSEAFRDIDFASTGAGFAGVSEHFVGQILQGTQGMGEARCACPHSGRSGHGKAAGDEKSLS